ncbi:MAG: hypothetical protein PWQ54_1667 [Bacteroidales bacterium]|nr:hypothetical protein [Bacteroidales bacterium]
MLVGVAAFLISIFWRLKDSRENPTGEKVGLRVICDRFPKFVLGFILVSLVFYFFIHNQTAVEADKTIKSYRSLWFNLAFGSIYLETRFADLIRMGKRKPLFAFLIAQAFNILVTLAVA